MDLSGIISISGKPGLYKVVAQSKNSVIVESLQDKKRFPAYASDRISALDDISMYTLEEDVPLKDVFTALYKKFEGKEGLSHKEDIVNLQEVLFDVLPKYDEDRVYPSDIKKLFQWYNSLIKAGALKLEEEPKKPAAKAKKEGEESSAPAAKKPAAKKTAKPTEAKPTAQKAAAKKPAANAKVAVKTPKQTKK
jgi:hypothetical protein